MGTPTFCSAGGGGVEPPTKFSKKGGGLTGPQILDGGCWERGADFFQGGCNFRIKINQNLKYLMTKKTTSKNIFLSFKLGNFI